MSLRNKSVSAKHLSTANLNDNEASSASLVDPQDEEETSIKRTNTKLSRRYTQKKKTPSMMEFMTEFEQERRPSPPPTPGLPTMDVPEEEEEETVSFDEPENFSDTARLTMHASAVSGYGDSPRLYKPASIDPELDRQKQHRYLTRDDIRMGLNVIMDTLRGVAKRVVNLNQQRFDPTARPETEQNRRDELEERRRERKRPEEDQDSDSSSAIDESIPATSNVINDESNTHKLIPTTHNNDLYGYSLKIFSPQNSFRVSLYRMFCWR